MDITADIGEKRLQEREFTGAYQKVAVDCWFTSTGRAMPKMIKYMDEEGCIQTLRNIQVRYKEKKHYGGIYCQRFVCRVVVDGREQEFLLMFHSKDGLWNMVLTN